MVNINRQIAEAAKKQLRDKREEETPQPAYRAGDEASGGILADRMKGLKELSRGERVKLVQYLVEPERCRLWVHHNRRYELLNEIRCADLIEGFKAMGRQEFPAIVRRITDDPEYEYEVICGARRHWTAAYLGWKLLVEPRELSDEEAFRLSDIENRDRDDISDYERALDYKDALGRYYQSQKQMAERLEVSEGWLSKYLDLASLPEPVVAAYPDITQIKVRHAVDLKPLLKDSKSRQRVLKAAEEVRQEQSRTREAGQGTLDGQHVIKRLKAVAKATGRAAAKGVLAEYQSTAGKPMLTVTRQGRSGLVLRVAPSSGAGKDEVLRACEQALGEFLK